MTRIAYLVMAAALVLHGCSSNEVGQESTQDSLEAPNVSPTAAPGVAWRYNYQFKLPDEAIARVQEAHASQCEAMGVARCRITGLRYSVTDTDVVSAMLELKLAPDVARHFGKQATAEVTKAHGRLQSTDFEGEDTTPATTGLNQAQNDIRRRIADIQQQLANSELRSAERAELQSQLNQLRAQLATNQQSLGGVQERLASTPMRFDYYGKGGISGFGASDPLREAAQSFMSSLAAMVTFVLQALALLLPWVALLALLILALRTRPGRAFRRFFRERTPPTENVEQT